MSTPLDLTTKLKAVNILLAGMGENPIDSLEAIQSSLAEKAVSALDESSVTIQAKGWAWNSEEDYPLPPNDAGDVPLPVNTIRISRVYHSGGDQLVQRGQRVYNRTDHTFTFPEGENVKVDIIFKLDWDDIPEFAKHPIFYIAQRRLQMRELTSTAIDQAIAGDVEAAITLLEQAEDAQGPANALTDNRDLAYQAASVRRRR